MKAAPLMCGSIRSNDVVAVLERYFFRSNAIKATSPPTKSAARITRKRFTIQAMPIPRAAHLTHQSPGDVIALMITKSTRTAGPTNKNFTARTVPIMITSFPSFCAFEPAFYCWLTRGSSSETFTWRDLSLMSPE